MPKAKTQQANKENKENAPKVQETESYKLEEGKDDDDSGEDSDSSDDEGKDENKPVTLKRFFLRLSSRFNKQKKPTIKLYKARL